jgi:hypothetical protein
MPHQQSDVLGKVSAPIVWTYQAKIKGKYSYTFHSCFLCFFSMGNALPCRQHSAELVDDVERVWCVWIHYDLIDVNIRDENVWYCCLYVIIITMSFGSIVMMCVCDDPLAVIVVLSLIE